MHLFVLVLQFLVKFYKNNVSILFLDSKFHFFLLSCILIYYHATFQSIVQMSLKPVFILLFFQVIYVTSKKALLEGSRSESASKKH